MMSLSPVSVPTPLSPVSPAPPSRPSTSTAVVLVRPVSAELPRLSRRVDVTSVQVRDLTRTISDHPPIRAALEARGFAKPMTKALTRGRLPSLQRLPLCRDIACIIGELPYLTAFGPLLARAAQRSAKNSFDSIVSRLQFKNFLSQWRTDTAYCHRCGSGPFALSQTAAAEGEDVGAACAVCSTILIAADRHGRDTRALVDFDAQVVRRRLTCLEDKLDVLSLIQRAIATHEKMKGLVTEVTPPSTPVQPTPPRGSEAPDSQDAALTLTEVMARRSRSSERRFVAPRAQVRTASVPMRPILFAHRGPAQVLPSLENAVVGKRSHLHEQPVLRR